MNNLVVRKKIEPALSSFETLVRQVKETLLRGKERIERAWVETYWQTGRHIHEHILKHEDRADYRAQVLERLSERVGVSARSLWETLQFYRAFRSLPEILRTCAELGWSHFRKLATIRDEKKRLEFAKQAGEEHWTARELAGRVRNLNWRKRIESSDGKLPPRLPFVCLGPFYTCRVIDPETIHSRAKTPLLDLGFSERVELKLFTSARFSTGTIVTGIKSETDRWLPVKAEGAAEDSLYTFKAYVLRVIDGDTLRVEFDLGFGNWHEETIRLKGIDAPEIDTPEGRAAKRFVERELSACEFITIKSTQTRREKWGRYLGEVFYEKKGSGSPVYLNQLLLDKGHAVMVRS